MVAVVLAAILLAVFRVSPGSLVALVPFGITALIARSRSSPSARRKALCVGAIGTLLLPFFAAICFNHSMWGYYVNRPGVDRRIVEARQVETITRVMTEFDARGSRTFAGTPFGELGDYTQVHSQEGDYYVLDERALRARSFVVILPAQRPERCLRAGWRLSWQILDKTGWLEDGEPGYRHAKELSGIVVEALGRDGHPLLFVGARGREVSNDHYPYYEFLFTSESAAGPLKLLSFQRFYYDVAGMEGIEWPAFLLVFAFLCLIPTLPVLLWQSRRRQ